jgi:5-methylthioribose kinase
LFETRKASPSNPGNLSFNENLTNKIHIPRVYYSNDKDFVIIMEDIGEETHLLSQWLSAKHSDSDIMTMVVDLVGFLQVMHKQTKQAINTEDSRMLSVFLNPEGVKIIKDYYYQQFPQTVSRLCPNLKGELEDILKQVKNFISVEENSLTGETLLMGDFWPNSICLDGKQLLWVIDCEMTRFGRGFSEIVQMCTNLYLMQEQQTESDIKSQIGMFRDQLIKLYLDNNPEVLKEDHSMEYTTQFIVMLVAFVGNPIWKFTGEKAENIIRKALGESQELFQFTRK